MGNLFTAVEILISDHCNKAHPQSKKELQEIHNEYMCIAARALAASLSIAVFHVDTGKQTIKEALELLVPRLKKYLDEILDTIAKDILDAEKKQNE